MAEFSNSRSERVSGRGDDEDKPLLPWHDDERLQGYVARGHDLVQKTPLGHQLECFRDNVRIQGMPATHPPGDWGYSTSTAYHRARETALRLWDTERIAPGAIGDLWAFCCPAALALEGLPGGRGRFLPVYPRTEMGRVARRSAGGKDACVLTIGRLLGPRDCPCDPMADGRPGDIGCTCFTRHTLARRLYAESATAKGELRKVWEEIHRQARGRVKRAVAAWFEARDLEDERRLQFREQRRAGARAQVVNAASSDG